MSTCDLNQEELALDPLAVLRCDPAVFRSGMASQQVILVNQQLTFQERVKFILNQITFYNFTTYLPNMDIQGG